MKTLVVLYAAFNRHYAQEALFSGMSAFERALLWAKNVPGAAHLLVLTDGGSELPLPNGELPVQIIEKSLWTAPVFFETLSAVGTGFDAIVFGYGDCPFYDDALTETLLETHLRYAAEYTFADGYPLGLTPEILHPSSCTIITAMLKKEAGTPPVEGVINSTEGEPIGRSVVFDSIKKDINAFEIETIIAPKDLRYLRINFACDSKRNTLQCERAFAECAQKPDAQTLCTVCETSPAVQRTLPAFFNIQIASSCSGSCTFCPYPAACRETYGAPPQKSGEFMPFEQFSILMRNIASFAEDGTVSLSLWGDCVLHPQFDQFVRETLTYPDFSLLIETDGSAITPELVSKIAAIVRDSPARRDLREPVIWIVGIDAAEKVLYEQLHGIDGFEKATAALETLLAHFPTAVYPQFVRMNENEDQMEVFYRHWQKKCGHVIIQKYDHFSGRLEQKKVADLTPLRRNPCWHLRRDMCVLLDGSVPRCRTALLSAENGSVFTDGSETVWERGSKRYAQMLAENNDNLCESCDEYYTFNF